ncbi:serine hydrolase [Larkinella humicola]|uniref:Serine hydrolase n=1 Tax=Larkinella humicola TaxID=2607654 RepID=A0A5N1JR85_9BACT|nr:serine hydrolase [Larkinella humicola]KAA9357139.1 serine hydrolase [Larkinella humicola]
MNTRFTTRILAFVLTVFMVPYAFAQKKAEKIEELMRQYVENRQFNGTVLVAENGKVIMKKGYGLANMEWNIPNTPDTKFRLGSVTKQFTAFLIMQLVDQGKLKVSEKITTYLPDYPKATGDKITVHHLLTHTSGIPNYTNFPRFFETMSRDPYAPEAFVKKFSDLPLDFEPGSKFSYSNSGYFLLGVLIEKVTGKPYATVLQEGILTPAKLKDTGYDLPGPILPKRAAAYEKRGGGYVNAPYLDMTIPYAAGSLYSTVEDLYRWDQLLYTDKLLSAASKKALFTPALAHYAYGWGVGNAKIGQRKDSVLIVSHGGGINGFNTQFTRLPNDKHTVILLNNTGGTVLGAIQANILNILYDQPYEKPKKSIATALRQTLATASLEKALQQFAQLKTDKAYSLNEDEMNELGYDLMREGKMKEALAVFNLNVEAYPQSFNVYDSRGEAYLKNGDKELAIKDYTKSVELNPRNTNGLEVLKTLGEKVAGPKDATVSAEILEKYVGKYELAPTFSITVTRTDTQLFAQATGQDRFELFPESETKFYLKVVPAQVTFVKDDKGQVTQLVLHQNGRDIPGKRIP